MSPEGADCSGVIAAFISSHAVNMHTPTRGFYTPQNRGTRMRREKFEPEQMDARKGGN